MLKIQVINKLLITVTVMFSLLGLSAHSQPACIPANCSQTSGYSATWCNNSGATYCAWNAFNNEMLMPVFAYNCTNNTQAHCCEPPYKVDCCVFVETAPTCPP